MLLCRILGLHVPVCVVRWPLLALQIGMSHTLGLVNVADVGRRQLALSGAYWHDTLDL